MRRIIITILLILAFVFSWFLIGIYIPQKNVRGEETEFLVKRGEGAKEISLSLEKENLIRWSSLFRLYVLIKGVSGELKAGKYSFSESMNIPQIVEKLVSGNVIKRKITIVEGWNLRDIGWYFENQGMFLAEELFELVGFPVVDYSETTDLPEPKDFSKDFDFLGDKPKNVNLEGYLFPDTYELSDEATVEEIVKKMLVNFSQKVNLQLKTEIKNQGKSIFEIITMASLIEKEVQTLEDKKIVSGILWKRLKIGMPLQVDATISYITGEKTTKISIGETRIDSPYNTYKYKGLPLGPISNPGLESITAAIYPEDSQYWYYLSMPEGKTIFSKTLEEHNIARAKYLK